MMTQAEFEAEFDLPGLGQLYVARVQELFLPATDRAGALFSEWAHEFLQACEPDAHLTLIDRAQALFDDLLPLLISK